MSTPVQVDLYESRFAYNERAQKDAVWTEIGRYLERYLVPGPVLDIGADIGYFVKNIRADERWATDIRDLSTEYPDDIRFVLADGLRLDEALPAGHFANVFMSNYLEHLPSPDSVVQQLRVAAKLLRAGGRLIVLQPNIRFVGGRYWDFIDHRVALTDESLVEAASLARFRTFALVPRFLPYSTKSRLPKHRLLVRGYLRFPLAWRVLGRQTLYVGERG